MNPQDKVGAGVQLPNKYRDMMKDVDKMTDIHLRGDCLKMALALAQTVLTTKTLKEGSSIDDEIIVSSAQCFYNFVTNQTEEGE